MRGASSWQMLSEVRAPGFGIVSQQAVGKRFLLYWLYWLFDRHVGEWALDLSGIAPWYRPNPPDSRSEAPGPATPVLATLSKDGKTLYLIVANGSSDRAVPARIALRGFAASGVSGELLSYPGMDRDPLVAPREDAVSDAGARLDGGTVTLTLPPQSVAFLAVRGR